MNTITGPKLCLALHLMQCSICLLWQCKMKAIMLLIDIRTYLLMHYIDDYLQEMNALAVSDLNTAATV